MTPTLSIIIPAYNEEKYLPATLHSVRVALNHLQKNTGCLGEIIVVNNNSTDQTIQVAESLGARVITHSERNISAVCNAGAQVAQGEMICRLDADSLVPETMFFRIYETLQTQKYIGGGVNIKMNTSRLWVIAGTWLVVTYLRLTGISVGLLFTRKEHFMAVGGFPEEILAREDGEFAYRLRQYGKSRGLQFANLRDVSILTADRKQDWSFLKHLKLYFQIMVSKKNSTG